MLTMASLFDRVSNTDPDLVLSKEEEYTSHKPIIVFIFMHIDIIHFNAKWLGYKIASTINSCVYESHMNLVLLPI